MLEPFLIDNHARAVFAIPKTMFAPETNLVRQLMLIKKLFNQLNHLLVSSGKAGTAKTNYYFILLFHQKN
jgi:hypothetical protein